MEITQILEKEKEKFLMIVILGYAESSKTFFKMYNHRNTENYIKAPKNWINWFAITVCYKTCHEELNGPKKFLTSVQYYCR